MVYRCCVVNCRGNHVNGPKVTLFGFPKDPVAKKAWLDAIGNDHFTPSKHSKVCHKHFKEADVVKGNYMLSKTGDVIYFIPHDMVRLKPGAVPQIFSDDAPIIPVTSRKKRKAAALAMERTASTSAQDNPGKEKPRKRLKNQDLKKKDKSTLCRGSKRIRRNPEKPAKIEESSVSSNNEVDTQQTDVRDQRSVLSTIKRDMDFNFIKIEVPNSPIFDSVEIDENILHCRLCANMINLEHAIHIFDNDGGINVKINVCLPISVEPADELPQNICKKCHKRLKSQHQFYNDVLKAEATLLSAAFKKRGDKVSDHDHLSEENDVNSNSADVDTISVNKYIQEDSDSRDSSDLDVNPSQDKPPSTPHNVALLESCHVSLTRACTKKEIIDTSSQQSSNLFQWSSIKKESITDNTASWNNIEVTWNTQKTEDVMEAKANQHACVICKCDEPSTENELREHLLKCHGLYKELIKVEKCLPGKAAPGSLDAEPDVKQSIRNFCSSCHKLFTDSKRYYHHLQWHDKGKPEKCRFCEERFPEEEELYQHMLTVHNGFIGGRIKVSRKWSCPSCRENFSTEVRLLRHEKKMHGKSITFACYHCSQCLEAFANPQQVCDHICMEHEANEESVKSVMIRANRLYSCEYCYKYFTTVIGLDQHRLAKHVIRVFNCRYCPLQFELHAELGEHMDNTAEHSAPHTTRTSWLPSYIKDMLVCELCARTFKDYKLLLEHFDATHGIEEPKTYLNFESKPKNMQLQKPCVSLRKFQCNDCSRAYMSKNALIQHMLVHSAYSPYMCDLCGRAFKQAIRLKLHQRNFHSSIKPFLCSVCNKTFKYKGDRDNHVLRHGDDRPYKCNDCPRSFKCKADLKGHVWLHLNIRPHVCKICNAAFKIKTSLKNHQLSHSGEKPYPCKFCARPFARVGDLRKHVRVLHGANYDE